MTTTHYPLVRFVTTPEVSATTRFDFNAAGFWADEDVWPDHDSFDLGVPTLEGEPDGVGVEFDLRELSFNLVVTGSKQDAARVMSTLARELLRRTNWLMFQLDAESRPVWFKTYRTQPGNLSLEWVRTRNASDLWGLEIRLAADPFAYGERVTLPAEAVVNDPTAATNPMRVTLPEILGDAPTPLRVECDFARSMDYHRTLFVASSADDAASAEAVVVDVGVGDGLTALPDVTAGVADAAYAGGSYRAFTFATFPTAETGVEGTVTVPRVGRYMVLARIARADTASTFKLRFGSEVVVGNWVYGDYVHMDRAASLSAGHATWVSLGAFTLPSHAAALSGLSEVAPSTDFRVMAARTSGTGDMRLDAIMFVPVEIDVPAATLYADYTNTGGVTGVAAFDGETEQAVEAVAGVPVAALPPTLQGGFPVVHPGMTNTLHLFLQTVTDGESYYDDNPDVVADVTNVTVSYLPRHLWLAGA